MRVIKNRWSRIISVLILTIAVLFVGLPLLWVLLTSLKTRAIAYQIPPQIRFKPTLENYHALIQKMPFYLYLLNSLIVSFSTSIIALIAGSMAAYSISRYKTGGAFFIGWILNSRTMPPVALVLPFFLLFYTLRLDQTLTALIIAHLTVVFPLVVMLLVSFFEGIPTELEEAALVDGCSRPQVLVWILVPLASPGLASAGILAFIFSWNEFLFALILTGAQTRTLPVAVSNFLTSQGILLGELSAATIVLIFPAVILTLMVRKYLVSGLTMGAIK